MTTAVRVAPYRHDFAGGRLFVTKAGGFTERRANREARESIAEVFANEFAETVNIWRAGIDIDGLGQAVAVGADIGTADAALGLGRMQGRLTSELLNRIGEAVANGAEIGVRFAPAEFTIAPELVTQIAASFIETNALTAVSSITESTRAGVQQALLDQLTGTASPTQAASQIGDLVGLNAQQVRRVNAFRFELEGSLIPGGVGETEATRAAIESRVRAESQRLLRERGRLIADTEIQSALMEGERGYYQVAADAGELDLDLLFKTWKTVDDGRVCPICMPLHGTEVRNDGSFELRRVGRFVNGPPAHPRCRCYLVWQIVGAAAAA